MAKKRGWKKNYYYRKRFRRYKGITQYFKARAEFVDTILFPGQDGGAPFFLSRANDVGLNRSLLTNQQVLEGYTFSVSLAGIFSYYKITGIGIEVIPSARNSSINQPGAQNPVVYLSYRAGNNTIMTLAEIKCINQTLILDPNNRQRRYWRPGPFADGEYANTLGVFSGAFSLIASTNGQYEQQPSWQIRIMFYFLYKGSKV